MKEQIYTIPINETLDAVIEGNLCTCPFCMLEEKMESNELDLILGASMMEPDIRIKTNEQGFCQKHFEDMLVMKNKLGLALILESHLQQLQKELFPSFPPFASAKGKGAHKRLKELGESCYICSKVDFHMSQIIATTVYLFDTEPTFPKKLSKQPYFCTKHYKELLYVGMDKLNKKRFGDFYELMSGVEKAYFEKINEDISWFCKKFDYRYSEEPWKDAKDAPQRAVKLLK